MKHLNNLRKLAANKSCATCTHEDKMGFKDVCMKFKIFICSDCKSAHQAFSHRCKSITMSNWTHAEVMELDASTNGGNEIHNATYLARMPPGYKRPMKGCHPNDMKDWVKATYIDLQFYDANGQPGAAPAPAPAPAPAAGPPRVSRSQTAPVKSSAADDLFGSFDSPTPPPAAPGGWTSFESSPAPASGGFGSGFGDSFGSSPTPASNGFGSFTAAPAAPPAAFGGASLFDAPAPAPTGCIRRQPVRRHVDGCARPLRQL